MSITLSRALSALLAISLSSTLFAQAPTAASGGAGSSGATGGVAGASAASGAQGANNGGASFGAGPNTSPVIPSGVRNSTSSTSSGATPSGTGFSGARSTFGGGSSLGSGSARSRFGNPTSTRQTLSQGGSNSQFGTSAPGLDTGAGGAFRPNRTYRSDLGGWETVGPYQAGANVQPYNQSVVTAPNTGARAGYNVSGLPGANAGQVDVGQSTMGVGGAMQTGVNYGPSVPGAQSPSFDNSLMPPSPNANGLPATPTSVATANGSVEFDANGPSASGMVPVRPRVGITMARGFTGSGARVARLEPDSAAYRAGLRPGDVITEFNGIGVYSYQDILATMESGRIGNSVPMTIWRNGESIPVTAELATQPR